MSRVKQKRLHSSRRRTRLRATPLGRELHRTVLSKERGPLPYLQPGELPALKHSRVRQFGANPMLAAMRKASEARELASLGDIKERLTNVFRRGNR